MSHSSLPALERAKRLLCKTVDRAGLRRTRISLRANPLTPEEAIGKPRRRDYPIVLGKERLIEAKVLGTKGQAFTDSPCDFDGVLDDVLNMGLETTQNRAIFVASMNAVLNHLGRVDSTVHCRDEEPELCAREIAASLFKRFGRKSLGLIGFNPAIAERLAERYGPQNLRITDLDPDNKGKLHFGVEIWDGGDRTLELIQTSNLVLMTGTTLVNGTFDQIVASVREQGQHLLVYGVTASGACELLGLERICPLGRSS